MTALVAELLDRCLADQKSNPVLVEAWLAVYPEQAAEVRELVQVASAIAPPPPVPLDEGFRLEARAELLARISAPPAPEPSGPLRCLMRAMGANHRILALLLPRSMATPLVICGLLLLLLSAVGGGVAYAAQGALPDETLYGFKRAIEEVQVALARDDEARAQAYLALAEERLHEIEEANARGLPAAARAAAEALVTEVAQAERYLDRAQRQGHDVTTAAARLRRHLAHEQDVLAAAAQQAPEPARGALAAALQQTARGLGLASAHVAADSDSDAQGPWGAGAEATNAAAGASTTDDRALAGDLPAGQSVARPDPQENGLLARLRVAEQALGHGHLALAGQLLDAFQHDLQARQQAGQLTASEYAVLYNSYAVLKASLDNAVGAQATAPRPPVPDSATGDADDQRASAPASHGTLDASPTAPTDPADSDGGRGRPGNGGPAHDGGAASPASAPSGQGTTGLKAGPSGNGVISAGGGSSPATTRPQVSSSPAGVADGSPTSSTAGPRAGDGPVGNGDGPVGSLSSTAGSKSGGPAGSPGTGDGGAPGEGGVAAASAAGPTGGNGAGNGNGASAAGAPLGGTGSAQAGAGSAVGSLSGSGAASAPTTAGPKAGGVPAGNGAGTAAPTLGTAGPKSGTGPTAGSGGEQGGSHQ